MAASTWPCGNSFDPSFYNLGHIGRGEEGKGHNDCPVLRYRAAHKGGQEEVHPKNDHEERHAPDYVNHSKGRILDCPVMGNTEKPEYHTSKKRKNA